MSHQNHYIFYYTNYYNTFTTKRKNMDILNGHSYVVEKTCFKIQNCYKQRQTFSVKPFWIQKTYSELFKIQLSKHSSFAEWFYWLIKPERQIMSRKTSAGTRRLAVVVVMILSKIKLMKGKALRKHSLHEQTAASVLLKLFISGNEWCHTTDTP